MKMIQRYISNIKKTQSPDNNVQRQVFNKLKVLEQNKIFIIFILYIKLYDGWTSRNVNTMASW